MKDLKLNLENYLQCILKFNDRQAGISLIYDPHKHVYTYNAYCLETKIMKELFTVEHDYLDDALAMINDEFGSWDLVDLSAKNKGCGSCAAK